MAFKVPKVEKSPGEKKAKEVEKKTKIATKGTAAGKVLTNNLKRDQSLTARKKKSLGKLRGKR